MRTCESCGGKGAVMQRATPAEGDRGDGQQLVEETCLACDGTGRVEAESEGTAW